MRQQKLGRRSGKVRVSSQEWGSGTKSGTEFGDRVRSGGMQPSRERRDETESRVEFGARVGSWLEAQRRYNSERLETNKSTCLSFLGGEQDAQKFSRH